MFLCSLLRFGGVLGLGGLPGAGCRRPSDLHALYFFGSCIEGTRGKLLKNALKCNRLPSEHKVSQLYSSFLYYMNIWAQTMQKLYILWSNSPDHLNLAESYLYEIQKVEFDRPGERSPE